MPDPNSITNARKKPIWLLRILGWDSLQYLVKKNLEGSLEKKHLSSVIGAIRERNKVVHEGRRVLGGDIKAYLTSIEQAVSYLKTPLP